ncbi:MAG: EcsC family protein [Thermodesulfobacteriota bacterium]|nr:EcsC family protein [Thermodesulfobacteriota bacterium]
MTLSNKDLNDLKYAKKLLEHPSIVVKITGILNIPVARVLEFLPTTWSDSIQRITMDALGRALDFAVMTMDDYPTSESSEFIHKIIAATSGAVGGAFGLTGLGVELPVSTILMLRSIADIARSEGEDIKSIEAKLACLEVFALGGISRSDDAAETGYFAVRAALANEVSNAAKFIATKGLIDKGAPSIVKFIGAVAPRFGINVTEKIAAQSIPVVGASGGILINTIFISHFQDIARGHFIVRRLERSYGKKEVQLQFEQF